MDYTKEMSKILKYLTNMLDQDEGFAKRKRELKMAYDEFVSKCPPDFNENNDEETPVWEEVENKAKPHNLVKRHPYLNINNNVEAVTFSSSEAEAVVEEDTVDNQSIAELYIKYMELREVFLEVCQSINCRDNNRKNIIDMDNCVLQSFDSLLANSDDDNKARLSDLKKEIHFIYLSLSVIKNNLSKYPGITIKGIPQTKESLEQICVKLITLVL